MTYDHTATAAYDNTFRGVTIDISADTIADTLGQDHRLDRLADAIEAADYHHADARQCPAGPIRDFARQQAIDAFAAELGDVTVTFSTEASLKLADQLIQAARRDPRLAAHPYLIELADCAVRRLLGIHQLLNGTPEVVQIPAVPA